MCGTIIFLIRNRLRLKTFEPFRFTNQNSKQDYYYFTKDKLMKAEYFNGLKKPIKRESNVSLNWLLNNRCKIRRVEDVYEKS